MRGYRISDAIGEAQERCDSSYRDEYGRGRTHRLGMSRNEILQWIVKLEPLRDGILDRQRCSEWEDRDKVHPFRTWLR